MFGDLIVLIFKNFGAMNFGTLMVLNFVDFGVFGFEDLGLPDINDLRVSKVDLKVFDDLTVNNFV